MYNSTYQYKNNKNNNNYNNIIELLKSGRNNRIAEMGFTDPDRGDGYNSDDLEMVPDEENELRDIDENDFNNALIEQAIYNRGQLIGFDSGANREFTSDDLQQEIFDVGLFGEARGKEYDYGEFGPLDFITLKSYHDKTKILMINNKDSFDDFTEKYGRLNKKDKQVYIRWKKVSRQYRGIYITSSALDDREKVIPFRGKTVNNWIEYDYNNIDKVILFKKEPSILYRRRIHEPFKGYIVDNFAIDIKDFASIFEPITHDKILVINDVKSFDIFTKRYGKLSQSNGELFISIKWDLVSHDYDGIYIEEDNFLRKNRYAKAYFDEKIYNSWWKRSDFVFNMVYLFR